jgi:hypothetical protein
MLRRITFFSWMLNLCLAGLVMWLITHRTAPNAQRSESIPVRTETVQRIAEIPPKQSNLATNEPFHWSRIASDDLKVYRDNLYAIGCPRPTVRDIIMAEINHRFEVRRQNLLAALQGRFWEYAIRGEEVMRTEWGGPVQDLNNERQQMIRDVLGKDDADQTDEQTLFYQFQRKYSWLPAEKSEKLWALEQQQQKSRTALNEAVRGLSDEEANQEAVARLETIDKEHNAARKELLSPEELEELHLRESGESQWAVSLSGFSPTEEQWRAVTKLRMAYQENMNSLGGETLSEDERKQRVEKLDAELKQSTKEVLGEEYHHYELASDGDYQQALRVTQRYGLPDALAEQAYQVQKKAMAYADAVRKYANLSDDERQARLMAMQQNAERTLSQALGDRAFATYKEYAGGWLKSLGAE